MTTANRILRSAAFLFLSAFIVVLASERAYWTVGGLSVGTLVETPLFYLVAVLPAFVVLGTRGGVGLTTMIGIGAIYSFVVEGVLTAVVYENGFVPFMALLFVGWHGMVAMVGFWYLAHRWLVERRLVPLALLAGGFGVYWGVWSITWTIPESLGMTPAQLADFGSGLTPRLPAEFAGYAFGVGTLLALAHWLAARVWPARWRPGVWSWVAVSVLVVGYFSLAVLPLVPWAPVMLGALMVFVWWRMGRIHDASRPNVIERLAGPVRLADTSVLLAMPLAAATAYAAVYALGLSGPTVTGLSTALSLTQMIGGAVAMVVLWRRTRMVSMADATETTGTVASGRW